MSSTPLFPPRTTFVIGVTGPPGPTGAPGNNYWTQQGLTGGLTGIYTDYNNYVAINGAKSYQSGGSSSFQYGYSPFFITGGATSLGVTAGNYSSIQSLCNNVGNNNNYLNTYSYRFMGITGATGDWHTASVRIQNKIDYTNQGFIEFNPPGYSNGVGLYGGNSASNLVNTNYGLSVDQLGSVTITTGSTGTNPALTINPLLPQTGNTGPVLLVEGNSVIQGSTAGHALYIKGSTGSSNCALYVNGDVCITGHLIATVITEMSDYRIKDNITPLKLDKYSVNNLNPVYFKYKNTEKENIGLIAHELQEHFPFLVEGEKDGKETQRVNYTGLIAVLIKEIQELKHEKEEIKQRLQNLEFKNKIELR